MIEFTPPPEINGDILYEEMVAAGLPLQDEDDLALADGKLRVANLDESHRETAEEVIDAHDPPPPPPDPDAELANAITGVRDNAASDDVKALCDALLGNLSRGRAAGRSP